MQEHEMKAVLIEYMAQGFLDNIIGLFKQDRRLYRFIPDMLGEKNFRVRLGTVALVEELVSEHRNELKAAVPGLIALLNHPNPTIRGDAASVLGTIGDQSAREALSASLLDAYPVVCEAARDALLKIKKDV